MNLPPFPSLPSSPQERLRWIAWGEEIARMERERCVQVCEQQATDMRLHTLVRIGSGHCAAAIRKEPLFNLVEDDSLPDDVMEVRDSATGALILRTKFTKEPG